MTLFQRYLNNGGTTFIVKTGGWLGGDSLPQGVSDIHSAFTITHMFWWSNLILPGTKSLLGGGQNLDLDEPGLFP